EAAEQFERAVHDLDLVVAELRQSRRRDRVFVGSALAVVVLVAGGLFATFLDDRRDSVARCREGNRRFDGVMQVIESATDGDSAAQLIVSEMRAVSILDCDGDGDTADDLPG